MEISIIFSDDDDDELLDVGLWWYSLSFAAPKFLHCWCCCFRKTLQCICAEMVEVIGLAIREG